MFENCVDQYDCEFVHTLLLSKNILFIFLHSILPRAYFSARDL